ncbi:MAG: hypothetical protein WC521_09490 [Bdellovibrionales bacterium]
MTLAEIVSPIPLWAVFGLLAASLSATMMLLCEKFKTPPFAMAFWNKVGCAIVMTPLVLMTGLPTNPVFYALLAMQALLWVVSDVVFWRGINVVGAGVVSRILPMAPLLSFFLWFAIDPSLIAKYTATPWLSAGIIVVFCLSAFFAWNLRDCVVTRKGLRAIWFVLCAAIVGSLAAKFITQQTDMSNGVFGYVFCEALMMVSMWLVYYAVKRPLPAKVMFGLPAIKSGLTVGLVSAFTVSSVLYAYYHIDNPAYIPTLRYLDSVIIFFFYRIVGRPNQGRLWASFGIVACAAALVVLKAQG